MALSSVVVKSFEKLVLSYLKDITGPPAVCLQIKLVYGHCSQHGTTPHPAASGQTKHLIEGPVCRLQLSFYHDHSKPPPAQINSALRAHLCLSVNNQLPERQTERQQLVRLGKYTSNTHTISTGAPQGCVLSPLLFSLYTKDCTSKEPSVKLLKFADDTTMIGLIQNGDESAFRQEVKELAVWCSLNNLVKTVEMIVDFRRNPPTISPLTIMKSTVTKVESFRFLGSTISQDLQCNIHIDSIVKKAQQRLYFLRQLRKFNLLQELLKQFYSAIIESVLCISITDWFSSATKSDLRRLQRVLRNC